MIKLFLQRHESFFGDAGWRMSGSGGPSFRIGNQQCLSANGYISQKDFMEGSFMTFKLERRFFMV